MKLRVISDIADRRRGSVLILVLWIAFGLVAITLYFANSMTAELRASENRVAALAADQATEGAVRYVIQVLYDQATNGIVPYLTDYACEAVPVGNAPDERANAMFWLIGRDVGQGTANQITFGLVDEGGKLNLNNPNLTLEMLEMLPRMTAEFAAAIIDWRDADEELSPGGAEAETYARLRPPYLCKNAPFDSVDELRLVAGATMEILLGEDLNRNGVLDPNELDENRNGIADPGILEYVTVYSREPNTLGDGSPRIALTDTTQLRELLTENFDAARADLVISRTTGSQSLLEFYARSGLTPQEFALIENDLTTENGAVIEGRVNVNTAPAVVLACIPGIGEDKSRELANYRLSNADSINSVAWVTEVLDAAQIREAGPYLTGQTYTFSADVAALGPFGRGYRRTRFVFDLTEGGPKVIYRQNLDRLGWALGVETRETWLANVTP